MVRLVALRTGFVVFLTILEYAIYAEHPHYELGLSCSSPELDHPMLHELTYAMLGSSLELIKYLRILFPKLV